VGPGSGSRRRSASPGRGINPPARSYDPSCPTELPIPGPGTTYNTDPEECAATIVRAAELGYRHVDIAQKYGNEAFVGDGVARTDVPREELFVATKIHEANLAYDDVHRTAAESLDRLDLDSVDLLYVRSPAASAYEDRYDPAETLRAFDELVEAGATRHVGVANFSVDLLEDPGGSRRADIPPPDRDASVAPPGRTARVRPDTITTSSRTARSCRGPSARCRSCGRSHGSTTPRPHR